MMYNHVAKVGGDVATEEYIKKLKEQSFRALRFDKIPIAVLSYDALVLYVSNAYSDLKITKGVSSSEPGIDEETQFLNKDNEVIVKVLFAEGGISGSFVEINCARCD